jgi:hypothetical protein
MTQQYSSRAVLMADGLSSRVRFKFQKEFLISIFNTRKLSNQQTDQLTVVMDGKVLTDSTYLWLRVSKKRGKWVDIEILGSQHLK